MEISITNSQRTIRISAYKVKKTLKYAFYYLMNNVRSFHFLSQYRVEISVLFVNDRKMREINLQYRGKDKTTDVLSFPQQNRDALSAMRNESKENILYASHITHHALLPLGDIVISLPQAKRQAKESGLTIHAEVSWLLIHGLLHLLGYEHEAGGYQARKMREIEMELLAALRVFV